MMVIPRKRYKSRGWVMGLKPVLIHVDEDDWDIFKEICGNYKASRRVRQLVSREIDEYTKEETKAQQFAGLTEA